MQVLAAEILALSETLPPSVVRGSALLVLRTAIRDREIFDNLFGET